MQAEKPMEKPVKTTPFVVAGVILVMAVMLLLLLSNVTNSLQAFPAFLPDIYFEGQYQIEDGPWNPVVKGQHIPATRGDVTLKGRFHMTAPDGEYLGVAGPGILLALYTNHIHVTVQEQGQAPYICDVESDFAGKDLCGELCTGYTICTEEEITLTFHNNHRFGNDRAIDDFLRELAVYADSAYEKDLMAKGNWERNAGLVFVIVGFVLLGTALFSLLLHIEGSGRMCLFGLCSLFAGGYFIYGSQGVFFWSDSVIGNTTILGICIMLYMLCACMLITSSLKGTPGRIAAVAVWAVGAACVFFALLSLFTETRFFDAWLWWAVAQSVAVLVLLVCLAMDIPGASKGKIASSIGAAMLLLGFEADFVGTALGWWQGGLVCKHIFVVLFAVCVVLALQVVPRNINAAEKAKKMEAEQKIIRAQLQENRIAVMISQIQPHFIYNTLGTIQQLCKEDPLQAADLVHNFSVYLRGNFSELDSTAPIRFSKELEHVRCYTQIELVRFPDMTVLYDIQTESFLLPALTVQPLVENAIKHGLMGREEGGTVTVTAYETDTHYCVQVSDDGVGFDTEAPLEQRKHVGIRNVRERLRVMCGGSLTVESQPGKGTTALIQIPKEGKKL